MIRVKVITPKALPDLHPVIDAVTDKELKDTQREFEKTTKTFKMSVVFKIKRFANGGEVTTNNVIYGYLDGGTKPHVIAPVRAKTLRFNSVGFISKTRPDTLNVRAGRKASPPTRYPLKVHHPGMKARNYSKIIAKRSEDRYARNMQKAIDNALRRKK